MLALPHSHFADSAQTMVERQRAIAGTIPQYPHQAPDIDLCSITSTSNANILAAQHKRKAALSPVSVPKKKPEKFLQKSVYLHTARTATRGPKGAASRVLEISMLASTFSITSVEQFITDKEGDILNSYSLCNKNGNLISSIEGSDSSAWWAGCRQKLFLLPKDDAAADSDRLVLSSTLYILCLSPFPLILLI